MKHILITTTIHSKELAEKLATLFVDEKLAACCHISGPISSIYNWEGVTQTDTEWQLQIKTRESLYDVIEDIIKDKHPYDLPEITAVPILEGSKEYLHWITTSTNSLTLEIHTLHRPFPDIAEYPEVEHPQLLREKTLHT